MNKYHWCAYTVSFLFLLLPSRCMAMVMDPARRKTFAAGIGTISAMWQHGQVSADDTQIAYETRDRKKNKDALVRDDIWYFTGQLPPRKIDLSNLPAGPKWNAWGACTSSDSAGGNSCTYVSLRQRIPAYSSYAFTISYGAEEFTKLGEILRQIVKENDESKREYMWGAAAAFVDPGNSTEKRGPSPILDALLKMVLMATGMLSSPNYTGPPFELLIARFYVNELAFSTREITAAMRERNAVRAYAAWEFGRDSFNSYLSVINRAIVPKVGDKLEFVS